MHAAHHSRGRSAWALVIIVITLVLFGLFWLWEKTLAEKNLIATPQPTSELAIPSYHDFSVLTATAAHLSIPEFSSLF